MVFQNFLQQNRDGGGEKENANNNFEPAWPTIFVGYNAAAVWPDWAIYWTLVNFLKALATITYFAQIFHIFRQFL